MARPFDPGKARLGDGMSMIVVKRREFEPAKVKLAASAQGALKEAWENTLGLITDAEKLVPYSADIIARPNEGTVLQLSATVAKENAAVANLLTNADRPPVAPRDLDPGDLYLYAVISDTEAGRVAMIKKQNPAKRASGGKWWALASNELEVVDEAPWQLHPSFDLAISSRGGYALRQSSLEQLLAESPLLFANVDEWVDGVSAALPIDANERGILAERCKQSARLRRRLRAINDRGHISRVSITSVKKHAKAMGLKPTDFIKSNKLVVSETNAEQLLQLLNEDLFLGGLTGDRFRSDGKEPVS